MGGYVHDESSLRRHALRRAPVGDRGDEPRAGTGAGRGAGGAANPEGADRALPCAGRGPRRLAGGARPHGRVGSRWPARRIAGTVPCRRSGRADCASGGDATRCWLPAEATRFRSTSSSPRRSGWWSSPAPTPGAKTVFLKSVGPRRGARPVRGGPPGRAGHPHPRLRLPARRHRRRAVHSGLPFDVLGPSAQPPGGPAERGPALPRADRRAGRGHGSQGGRGAGAGDGRDLGGARLPRGRDLAPGRPAAAGGARQRHRQRLPRLRRRASRAHLSLHEGSPGSQLRTGDRARTGLSGRGPRPRGALPRRRGVAPRRPPGGAATQGARPSRDSARFWRRSGAARASCERSWRSAKRSCGARSAEAAARARKEARGMLLEARREVEAAIGRLQEAGRDGVPEREGREAGPQDGGGRVRAPSRSPRRTATGRPGRSTRRRGPSWRPARRCAWATPGRSAP